MKIIILLEQNMKAKILFMPSALFIFLFINAFLVSPGNCQSQPKLDDKMKENGVSAPIKLCKEGDIEKVSQYVNKYAKNDTKAVLAVSFDENLKNKNLKIDSVRINARLSYQDTIIINEPYCQIIGIECNQHSVNNRIELSFINPSNSSIIAESELLDVAICPGLLIVMQLQEEKIENKQRKYDDQDAIKIYPNIEYYNLSREIEYYNLSQEIEYDKESRISRSLLGFRLSSFATIGSLTWYGIRRLKIDEDNYKKYLNAQTPDEEKHLKDKCDDGRDLTQCVGWTAFVSGVAFGIFFIKDILWPWVSGKEILLASKNPAKNNISSIYIMPQFSNQEARLNLAYRF